MQVLLPLEDVLVGGLAASLVVAAALSWLAVSRSRALKAAVALRFTATHDALTGLANRTLFHEQLTHALSRAARYRRRVAVLFLDLDRFKTVNDTLGHGAGDALLREIAHRLRDCLRDSDIVARLAGDEFAIVMEDYAGASDAITVAKKILARIAAPARLGDKEFTPSASIGISAYPEDGASLEALLKNADIAMYRAKAKGRDNYQFYSAQSDRHASERRALEADLRRAIDRDELVLEYQPRFDLAARSIAGIEALVRWRHAELGLLPPAKFMPLAEETGLSAAVGDWMLRAAGEQSRLWRQAGLPAGRVALDLLACQIADGDFPRKLGELLAAAGAPADGLELAVSESMLMRNPEGTAELLHRLSRMGIALWIDDFGAGYCSLAYLKSLPISGIRIDSAFVKSIPGDPNGMAIAQGVIALGHNLRRKVVAPGVDTVEQQEFLVANGCDQAQGNLLSGPLSAPAMTALLELHPATPLQKSA